MDMAKLLAQEAHRASALARRAADIEIRGRVAEGALSPVEVFSDESYTKSKNTVASIFQLAYGWSRGECAVLLHALGLRDWMGVRVADLRPNTRARVRELAQIFESRYAKREARA